MVDDLFKGLSEMSVLRRAWHLARNDSRTDFMYDPFRFSDFGFRIDEYLNGISNSLKNDSYHPAPLKTIDVPKSSLSVRPGSVLSIEDRIVLFAFACLVAPQADKKLPPSVYSWRVRNPPTKKELFEDHQLLRFPFLKRKTIRRRLDFVEEWYGVWPRFIRDIEIAYERDGYRYMVVSDIVSYFENIDLGLLRDVLIDCLPKQLRIVNFVCRLLGFWAWPTVHGTSAPSGIPQGNGVSSFLGNLYLLPIDRAFVAFSKKRDVKYFRYMDDVKVLTKDIATAREALFLMNRRLRELRLNIQGAKTRILQGEEIKKEIFDDRLDAVNDIIDKIQKKRKLSSGDRNLFITEFKKYLKQVKGRKRIIQDKELRLFRRLTTGFTLLRHSRMVKPLLDQLERNPDARLLNSAARYLRFQEKNKKKIADWLIRILTSSEGLFFYQQAYFFMYMRYVRNIPAGAWKEARRVLNLAAVHWYVTFQDHDPRVIHLS